MSSIHITVNAAKNLISCRDKTMAVNVATELLIRESKTAELTDETTTTGDLIYRVPNLGGKLIVKEVPRERESDYGLIAVAFIRERLCATPDDISRALKNVHASMAEQAEEVASMNARVEMELAARDADRDNERAIRLAKVEQEIIASRLRATDRAESELRKLAEDTIEGMKVALRCALKIAENRPNDAELTRLVDVIYAKVPEGFLDE
jgi:hypothetical protein